ncbi:threonine/serine exporter ThrE [Corynebacterium alimapuense]|uniref:Amino acid export carrier protein n=1 Tax=Corynebacterium alimapuense TaxID=1576874 RepID=A0A3M8KAN4_9CORY|nr:threonine/serine exporter family protein [Corynebacterium alimapuense]RNE49855.1 amino acid export carrier protein [Corynebacterium alimapuense]
MFDKLGSFFAGSGRIATIDAAKAAPPPSPLAPIDLTQYSQVAAVMDLAARIGDILLSSGTSNSDTKAQIHAVNSAYGLHYCHVDITMNTITIFAHMGENRKTPVSVFRVVRSMTTDFSKLSEVDRLIRSIQAGATPPETAEKILDELATKPAQYGTLTAIGGWGLMGGSISVMLGGGWLVAITAFFTSILIMSMNTWLSRKQLPVFFQNVFGGVVATVPAALIYSVAADFGIRVSPSQTIASGIIVLLAGLTLVQSLQDGITNAPVTASARFFETMLFTGAIVAGVGIGIQISSLLGISLPLLETGTLPNFASSTVRVFSGATATVGFAIASYAEWSSVVIAWLTAVAGSVFYYFILLPAGSGTVIAASVAAVVIGLAGGLLARRFLIPPLITAIAGITPFLPGLSVYQGMYAAMHEQMLTGFTNIATALAVACGLAAGVVLGEWVARRLRRPPILNPYRYFRVAGRQTFQQIALHQKQHSKRRVRKAPPK